MAEQLKEVVISEEDLERVKKALLINLHSGKTKCLGSYVDGVSDYIFALKKLFKT